MDTRDQSAAREPFTRIRKPRVKAVGSDPDHPTDDQAHHSPEAAEWATAREKERDQLVKYGVFTKTKNPISQKAPKSSTPNGSTR